MPFPEDRDELLQRIEMLWSEEDYEGALAAGEAFTERWPDDAEGWHRRAVLHVGVARLGPGEDHLGSALECLNRCIDIDGALLEPRELRANLLVALGHQPAAPFTNAAGRDTVFEMAVSEFLRLEREFPGADEELLGTWRVEAARAAFLAQRGKPMEEADFAMVAGLYARADQELHDAGDWFFRGMATLEAARGREDPRQLRVAAACFLRALEEQSFLLEGRYFAADALLLLSEPTEEEFDHAALLVHELAQAPQRDFMIDALRKRLELRAELLGRTIPDFPPPESGGGPPEEP